MNSKTAQDDDFRSELTRILDAGEDDLLIDFWQARLRTFEGASAPLVRSADLLIQKGRLFDALQLLDKAKGLGHQPDEIFLRQAHALRRQGQPEQALELLFGISPFFEDRSRVEIAFAHTYLDLRMISEAQARLENELFGNPENPNVRLVFARFYALTGHYAKGLKLLASVAALPEFALEAGLAGLFCHRGLCQWGKHREVVQVLGKRFPHDPEVKVLNWEASVREHSGYPDPEEFKSFLESFPGLIPALTLKVRLAMSVEDFPAARRALYEAIDRADWHEQVQVMHLEYAFEKDPEQVDWEFFEELAEKGKHPGFFLKFIELREQLPLGAAARKHYLDLALAREPESVGLILLTARSLTGAKAAVLYLQAAKIAPFCAEAWAGVGKGFLLVGKKKEALESFQKSLKADPGYTPVYQLLASLLAETGNHQQAIKFANHYLESNPEDPEALLTVSKCMHSAGETEKARTAAWNAWYLSHGEAAAIREWLWKSASDAVTQAEFLIRTGKGNDAWPLLAEFLEKEPHNGRANALVAEILIGAGDFILALEKCETALRAGWGGEVLGIMARSYHYLALPHLEETVLSQMMARQNLSAGSMLTLGLYALTAPRNPQSEVIRNLPFDHLSYPWNEIFREQISSRPDALKVNEYARFMTGNSLIQATHFICLEKAGTDPENAAELYQDFLSQNDPQSLYWVARYLLETPGREGDGIRLLLKLQETTPQHLAAKFLLAEDMIRNYRLAPALGLLTEIKNLNPEIPRLWILYGRVYLAKKEAEMAMEALEKAISIENSDPEAYILLGNAFLGNSDYENAKAPLLKAAQFSAIRPELRWDLAGALLRVEEASLALKMVKLGVTQLSEIPDEMRTEKEGELLDKLEHFISKI